MTLTLIIAKDLLKKSDFYYRVSISIYQTLSYVGSENETVVENHQSVAGQRPSDIHKGASNQTL